MVFRSKGAKTYKIRVEHPDGRFATLSTGCRDEDDAKDVEAIVDRWRGKKGKKHERLDVIDALVDKRVFLPDTIDAYHAGTLEAFLAAHATPDPVVPLLPLVDQWIDDKRKSKKGGGQADTYRKQFLVLYPETAPALALFTRKELWARLDKLDVDGPTKNRYRSAASSLAKFLVKRELLERNFVRDIEGFGENDPRLVYYEIADAKRLIAGMPQPYAAIAAFSLGFCAEWGAIERAIAGDVQRDTDPIVSRVRGTKRSWRDRYIPLVPELAWTMEYVAPALEGKLPAALVFDAVPEWRAIDVQRATAKTLKIVAVGEDEFGAHSIHDWRHTHAVALLRWGYSEQIAAEHEGHKNTTLVRERYGRFKPTKHDYAKVSGAISATTNSTTSMTNHLKRGGAK